MTLKNYNLFKIAFAVSLLFILIASIIKIYHLGQNTLLLLIALVSTLVYVVLGIKEVNTSKKISGFEKILWTVGFIFFNVLAGFLYLILGRKRVV